jgi:diguanylate cyclase (GGDEF)-like protein
MAAVCISLSALAFAGSLAYTLLTPDAQPSGGHNATGLHETHVRLIMGGVGAIISLAIGITGVLYWPRRDHIRLRRAEQSVSTYDSMTGLPTRRLLAVLLGQALARAAETRRLVGVLVIELDYCRPGSPERTMPNLPLIARVQAARIKSTVNTHDAVARLDEHRFAVVLENGEQPDGFLSIARAIQSTIALPLQVEGQELLLSCRIGGAVAPADGTDADTLLEKAAQRLPQSQNDDASVALSSEVPASLRDPESAPAATVVHPRSPLGTGR